jgi:hypothetical protein
MAIEETKVKRWLQDEGLFFQSQTTEGAKVHYSIKVPLDVQQSINMGVVIPRDNEDQLRVQLQLMPTKPIQDIFGVLPDNLKAEVLRRLAEKMLAGAGLFPAVGQQGDGKLVIIFSRTMYEDAPITKHLLMEAISGLRLAFVLYEVISEDLFKEYGNREDPLVRP